MFSYEVVALTIEAADRIRFFTEYYLRNGASRVTLFHDGATPARGVGDRVSVIPCDGAFWGSIPGGRPDTVEARQRCVYDIAYRNCRADWLLVVDTDEFVTGFDRIAEAIVAAPHPPPLVRIPSAEALFAVTGRSDTDFSARHFRVPQNRYLAQLLPRLLYPGYGHLFIRGLLGHAIGKQFIRAGLDAVEIGIHSAAIAGRPTDPLVVADYTPQKGVFLCHFDAISYPQWREKWDRRVRNRDAAEMGAKRDRQMALYLESSEKGDRALRALFQDLYGVTSRKFRVMQALGLAFAFDLSAGEGAHSRATGCSTA